ncbi:MAG: hypothetical protein ACKOX6_16830 [Bdellovibrio sp.]
MKKTFEVSFKLTYEGHVTVEATSIHEAAQKVKSEMGVSCTVQGEDALEVESYIHVRDVTSDDEET